VEGQQTYLSPQFTKILEVAQRLASSMKDDFVAQEHLLLALYKKEESVIQRELKNLITSNYFKK
jgi:ATP-dependent Clp protease ATP-binding subunit ClpA